MLDLCIKLVGMIFWTLVSNGFLWAVGGNSATKTARRQRLAFSSWECYLIGGGHCPFRLEIPLGGQLLWGSHGTPHNEFLGKAQVLPMVKEVRDLCPQRLQLFELRLN